MLIPYTRYRPNFNSHESEVISEGAYYNRRQFVSGMALAAAGLACPSLSAKSSQYSTSEKVTSKYSVTHYNNFYEFSLSKEEPAMLAKNFKTKPWHVVIEGEAKKTGRFDLNDILKWTSSEERIYRLRCVEAWSMVVPWMGFELNQLLKHVEPTSKAKYVELHTLYDPKQMPGQKKNILGFSSLDWPYVEGLRMDEAMHPLTILATGVFGKDLPPQNGAPLRLVVPWKYGFKGIKSIVKIKLTEKQPLNSWAKSAPSEYGFYANVNPAVAHPRWSQAKERRILNESLLGTKRIKTEYLNGYAEHVAGLYQGMDLKRFF